MQITILLLLMHLLERFPMKTMAPMTTVMTTAMTTMTVILSSPIEKDIVVQKNYAIWNELFSK